MPEQEVPPVPVSEQDSPKVPFWKKRNNLIFVLFGFLLVIVLGVAGYFIFRDKHVSNENGSQVASSFISGTVGINGDIPQNATVAIGQRVSGSGKFQTVLTNLPAVDGVSYSWTNAENGQLYDLQAYVQIGGETVAASQIMTIAAPATGETLDINLPASQPAQPSQTTVSGIVDLNGYIPPNATITVAAQQSGASGYTNVATNLSAADGVAWTWSQAQTGSSYTLQAYLMVAGSIISQSTPVSVTAPAANETLVINSTATPPAPATVSVTGSINLNGVIPQGSTISVASRPTGTQTFNIFTSNLPASNGVSWNFTQAQSGTSYDFQAYLQSNGQTISTSQVLTVSAPANNEILTLNAQTQAAGPVASSLTNTCNGKNPSSNLWQVTIGVNNNSVINNAQQYWVTIGTNQGGNNVFNSIVNAQSSGQEQNIQTGFILSEGQQYYAQYAYATCQNCSNFSQFSPSVQIYCTTPNTPTPTLTPTSTISPTPQS